MSSGPAQKLEYVLFMSPGCKFCVSFMNKLKQKPDLMKKMNIIAISLMIVILYEKYN